MAGRIRPSSRRVGSVLVAAAGVLALVIAAPAAAAGDAASPPAYQVAGAGQSDRPVPTIVVEPSTGLSPGQTITVTGSGFTPGSSIGVAMCPDAGVDRAACDFSTARTERSDGAGGFTLRYEVVNTVNGLGCVPARCLIGASNLDVPDEIANRVGLGFTAPSGSTPDVTSTPVQVADVAAVGVPEADVAAPPDRANGIEVAAQATPTISVLPSTGLTKGQTVTITGSGFTPGSSVGVSLCDDPFVDGTSCDFSTAQIGRSDSAGAFTLSYQLVDTINGHTCVPTGCLLGAANLNVDNEFANRVSLSFGTGSAPTPTPTPEPPPTAPGPTTPGAGPDSPTTLANTGQSDSLPFLALAGFALVTIGAALTVAARRARALATA